MSQSADVAARTQRFNEAACTFTPLSPSRHAKLMPMKDGIIELRLIRDLLATIDVSVGTDTIARFLADVTGDPTPAPPPSRSGRQRAVARSVNHPRPAVNPAIIGPSAVAPAPAPPHNEPATERPRTRGPRIADPRNL